MRVLDFLAKPMRSSWGWLAWGFVLVLAVATFVRAWNLTTWSMWEDEEGSMTLAQNPFRGFQAFFPVYFIGLKLQMQWTGLSVGAARVLPAFLGVLSIALTYLLFRRSCSPAVALLAAFFLALNLGHVFFSQSVRYYTTALVFQVLSLGWFFEGFERDRPGLLLASLAALVLALLTHFSAVLLAPVFVGYLLLAVARRESAAGYRLRNYLLFFGILAGVLAVFAWLMMQLRNMIGGWAIPSMRDPVHTALNVLAYFGLPLCGLGLLSPWLARQLPARVRLFLWCGAGVPVLELLVIARLNVVNVAWYYAFIAMVPLALLAGATLVGAWQRGLRWLAAGLGVAALAYSVVFLGAYHIFWHGDRPRWAEAANYLRQAAQIRVGESGNPEVFATVPGVVAFYLGADPRKPDTYAVVKMAPQNHADTGEDSWHVVETKVLTPEYRGWLENHCTLQARFEAKTGPIDRSVLVYHRRADSARAAQPHRITPTEK
jgi:4-amino-4-deoxy-L-arabinose transferase-like glycosyltransferase